MYLSIHIYLSIDLSIYLSMYLSMNICTHIQIYHVCAYTFMHTENLSHLNSGRRATQPAAARVFCLCRRTRQDHRRRRTHQPAHCPAPTYSCTRLFPAKTKAKPEPAPTFPGTEQHPRLTLAPVFCLCERTRRDRAAQCLQCLVRPQWPRLQRHPREIAWSVLPYATRPHSPKDTHA